MSNTAANHEKIEKINGAAYGTSEEAYYSFKQVFEYRKQIAIHLRKMTIDSEEEKVAYEMLEECNKKIKQILYL